MNKEWSELNRMMQTQIKKKDTYEVGMDTLFGLREQLMQTSKELNLKELYSYIFEVKESTEKIIKNLSYTELKKKVSEERKQYLKSLNVVSCDENLDVSVFTMIFPNAYWRQM